MLLWVIVLGISIAFVYHYASVIEKDPTKSVVYNQRKEDLERFAIPERTTDEETMTGRQKAVIWVFALSFIIMILGLVPWTSLNKHFTVFESINKWLTTTPVLGTIVGKDAEALGTWYFNEITMLFFLMSIVVMLIYRMKEADYIDAFIGGMADFMSVAIIVAVARGIQVVMNNGLIAGTILHWGEVGLSGLSQSVFIVLTFVFYLLMSFLIPSTSGLAAATMGIIGPLGHFAHVSSSLVITAYQAGSGWVNLITPTSAVVMGALAIAHVNISTWWKWTAKLMIMLFVAVCLFLGISAVL